MEAFDAIHHYAPYLDGAGTWDVLAWRADEVLFLESKQHGSSDHLRHTQLAFLEAATAIGIGLESFAVVEYQSGRGASPATRQDGRPSPGSPRPAIALPPDAELLRLVEAAANAPAGVRIELYRDRIAAFGSPTIGLMETWIDAGRSPGFASMVLEAVGKGKDPTGAIRALRRLRGLSPDLASIIDPAIARVEASRRAAANPTDRRRSGDVYVETGTPPREQGPCGIRNRDGSECHNPGRHLIGETWSCTTHLKAATRHGLAHP